MISVFALADAFLSLQPMSFARLQNYCFLAEAYMLTKTGRSFCDGIFQAEEQGAGCLQLREKQRAGEWPSDSPPETAVPPEDGLDPVNFIAARYKSCPDATLQAFITANPAWQNARMLAKSLETPANVIDPEDMKGIFQKRQGHHHK